MKTILRSVVLTAIVMLPYTILFSQSAEVNYRVRIRSVEHKDKSSNTCHGTDALNSNGNSAGAETESNCEFVTEFILEDDASADSLAWGFDYIRFANQEEWVTYAEDLDFYGTSRAHNVYMVTDAWEEDSDEDFSNWPYTFHGSKDDCRVKKTHTFADFRTTTPKGLTGDDVLPINDDDGNKWRARLTLYWGYSGTTPDLDITHVHQTFMDEIWGVRSHTVYLEAGREYVFNTIGGNDNYLRLYDSNGFTIKAQDDDGAGGGLARITYTPSVSGIYYLENSGTMNGKSKLLTNSFVEYYIEEACGTNPTEEGNGEWAVHFYPGQEFPQANHTDYAGRYYHSVTGNSGSFYSDDAYPVNGSPVESDGYEGCWTNTNDYTLWYRGTGFNCGTYRLVSLVDDHRLKFYRNGVLEADGTFDTYDGIYLGNIRSTDQLEIITYVDGNHSGEHGVGFINVIPSSGTLPNSFDVQLSCGTDNVTVGLDPNDLGSPTVSDEYAFYSGSCGGTYVGDENGFTATITSPTTYYLAYTDGCGNLQPGCVSVTVDPEFAADAGVDQVLDCETSTTLGGSTPLTGIGEWTVVSGSGVFQDANDPNTLVTGLSDGENEFRWTYTTGACTNTSDEVIVDQGLEGDPTQYGVGHWKVHAYNERSWTPSADSYRGYYEVNNLFYDTEDDWAKGSSPSSASSWVGCSVPNDDFFYSYKRKNFYCGTWEITVGEHRNGVRIYIDDNLVHTYWGNGGPYNTPVWTGTLDNNSKVEIQQLAWSGNTFHSVIFQRISNCGLFKQDNSGIEANGLAGELNSFPNPFDAQTTLRFSAASDGEALLQVFDLSGKLIATPFEGLVEAGVSYEAAFSPGTTSSGIYLAVLKLSDGSVENRKLIQLK